MSLAKLDHLLDKRQKSIEKSAKQLDYFSKSIDSYKRMNSKTESIIDILETQQSRLQNHSKKSRWSSVWHAEWDRMSKSE